MAYHCLHTNSFTGYEEALSFISTSLQTMGWTLYDDVSSTEKVFTSTGSDNQFVNAYVRIYISTYLQFNGYMWWDNSTHAGTGKTYTHSAYNYITIRDNHSIVLYGDEDEIVIWHAGIVSNSKCIGFGFVQPYIVGYTVASGISSGSNIIVDVDSTANLMTGANLMIIGSSTEGRDAVELKEIISDTQIELTSTPRTYASGAKIGHYPCTFYCSTANYNFSTTGFHYVCGAGSASTIDGDYYEVYVSDGRFHATSSQLDPEDYLNKYIVQPFGLKEQYTPYSITGYCKYIKYAPVGASSATGYEPILYCVGEVLFSGTPTSTTSSGIIDIGHSWGTDKFKDKIIVITSGPGLGETRKVSYNNNDTLSINTLWSTSPDNSSTYEIYSSVYRNFSSHLCMSEIID